MIDLPFPLMISAVSGAGDRGEINVAVAGVADSGSCRTASTSCKKRGDIKFAEITGQGKHSEVTQFYNENLIS